MKVKSVRKRMLIFSAVMMPLSLAALMFIFTVAEDGNFMSALKKFGIIAFFASLFVPVFAYVKYNRMLETFTDEDDIFRKVTDMNSFMNRFDRIAGKLDYTKAYETKDKISYAKTSGDGSTLDVYFDKQSQ